MSRLETRSEQADVDRALQRAARHEARRTVSWLLATAIVTVAVALAIGDTSLSMVVAAFGIAS